MDVFKAMIRYRATRGLDLVGNYHAQIVEAGSVAKAAELVKEPVSVLRTYQKVWGTLRNSHIHSAARNAQLPLAVVVELGTTASYRLRHHKNRIGLLVKLCSLVAGTTIEEAKSLINKHINIWLGDHTRHLDIACMHTLVGKDGKRRLTAALSAPVAARIDTILHKLAERLRHENPKLQYDQAYAQALTQKLLTTGGGTEPAQFGPMFMIATNHHFHDDGKITTTDGALVDIVDVVDTELAPTGWAAVTGTTDSSPSTPLVGVLVKVHNRFASEPQRLAAIMETLVCAWPECDVPAAKCQIHHIKAHHYGGLTSGENLTPLCKKHNGKNDDNPAHQVNGRIERDPVTGQPGLRRTHDTPLRFNTHPTSTKTTIAYNQH